MNTFNNYVVRGTFHYSVGKSKEFVRYPLSDNALDAAVIAIKSEKLYDENTNLITRIEIKESVVSPYLN